MILTLRAEGFVEDATLDVREPSEVSVEVSTDISEIET